MGANSGRPQRRSRGRVLIGIAIAVAVAIAIAVVAAAAMSHVKITRTSAAGTSSSAAVNPGGTVSSSASTTAGTIGGSPTANAQARPTPLPTSIPDVTKAQQQIAATKSCGKLVRTWLTTTARPQLQPVVADVSAARVKADLNTSVTTLNAPTGAVTQLNHDLVGAEGALNSTPTCAAPLKGILTVAVGYYVTGAQALMPGGQGATAAASSFRSGNSYLFSQAKAWLKKTYGDYNKGLGFTP